MPPIVGFECFSPDRCTTWAAVPLVVSRFFVTGNFSIGHVSLGPASRTALYQKSLVWLDMYGGEKSGGKQVGWMGHGVGWGGMCWERGLWGDASGGIIC